MSRQMKIFLHGILAGLGGGVAYLIAILGLAVLLQIFGFIHWIAEEKLGAHADLAAVFCILAGSAFGTAIFVQHFRWFNRRAR